METNKKEIVRKSYEIFNTGNTSEIDKIISPDFQDRTPDPLLPEGKGPKYMEEAVRIYRKAFPDMKIKVNEIIAEGDFVSARVELTGTNTGEIMGQQPTNKKIKADGIDMVKFSNGKISEHWGVWDYMAIMQQLGLIPEEENQRR